MNMSVFKRFSSMLPTTNVCQNHNLVWLRVTARLRMPMALHPPNGQP
jgi:hypothetical protein